MSIVHAEQSYFLPQLRTKILNEGAAVLMHQEICQRLFLPGDQYWEYEHLNASVVQPHQGDVNPYNLGSTIVREIMRIATDPEDEERERWHWAGEVDPFEQVRRIIRAYDDEALLREFLSEKVCERCRLYAFDRSSQDPRRIRVSSREAEVIREVLIAHHAASVVPRIEIVDADFRGRGELLLEHRHEGVGLDPEYARGTLTQLAALWGKACTVRTVKGRNAGEPLWYTGHTDGSSEQQLRVPASR
jgi:stage V sporulation protein R